MIVWVASSSQLEHQPEASSFLLLTGCVSSSGFVLFISQFNLLFRFRFRSSLCTQMLELHVLRSSQPWRACLFLKSRRELRNKGG